MNFKFPAFSAIALDTVVTNASPEAGSLLTQLLYWNPSRRPTTAATLRLPYFQKHIQSHINQPNRRLSSNTSTRNKGSIPVTRSDYHVNHMDEKELSTMKPSLTYSELGNVDSGPRNGNDSEADASQSLLTRASGAGQQSRSSTDSTLTRASGISVRDGNMSRSHASRAKTNSRSAGMYAPNQIPRTETNPLHISR